jgi:hypothetical protein
MAWWTFNKQDGIIEYKMPNDVKPEAEKIKEMTEELGFGNFESIHVGNSEMHSENNFWIKGYEPKEGKPKVPFKYLLWVRIGSTYAHGVFLKNFPDLVEFLKYVSVIPKVLNYDADESVDMINESLRQIAYNIDSLGSKIEGNS